MDVEKSCIQFVGRRKDTTFQIYSSPTNFLNLGKKGTTLSFACNCTLCSDMKGYVLILSDIYIDI